MQYTCEGTRFLLFPQPPFLEGFETPESVEVSSPLGSVGPGPSGERMYAVYPHDKLITYGTRVGPRGEKFTPPWQGPAHPPALPDEDGHFDHLEVGTPQFEMAHLYGSASFVLDVWEGYFDQPINWHFGDLYERMELIIMPRFPNATMGYGFMEMGGYRLDDEEYRPFSLNFDIIGHEVGHSIIYPIIGLPDPERVFNDYYGFHECAADLVGLISSLHFDRVVEQLLANTRGNLYALNRLNRVGELAQNDQIRVAANELTLWDFVNGWRDEHDLGQPLTAAIFDTLVDVFHERLKSYGVISEETENLSDALEDSPDYEAVMQDVFDERYATHSEEMRTALLEARDHIGTYLAVSFSKLTPTLRYRNVAESLLEAEFEVSGGEYQEILAHNLWRRGIGVVPVGPRLTPPD
ncbi:MAG: hypothetical protein GY948_16355, partial [Alphaproteobacteria bacterium]|nr:hypothetical protein [Alphaproteobacteria bacterium]